MTVQALRDEIRALSHLEPAASPLVSWYLDLHDESGMEAALLQGLVQQRQALSPVVRMEVDEALSAARRHLHRGLQPGTRSVALFVRAGCSPLLRALEFEVALPSIVSLSQRPRIYPLAELADNYHRFALLWVEGGAARLLQVELGRVVREWEIPAPAQRPGRRVRTIDAARESLESATRRLAEVMRQQSLGQWILAADPWSREEIEPRLDYELRRNLYGVVATLPGWRERQVAAAAAEQYRRGEELESQRYARQVWLESARGGPAVSGRQASRSALMTRHAETLVLLGRKSPRFHLNPELRDDLVHLAQRAECHVEFVDESMPLAQLGGMGCLLRA
jgi:hypothetical protein